MDGYFMENPIKMDDLGGPPPFFGNTCIAEIRCQPSSSYSLWWAFQWSLAACEWRLAKTPGIIIWHRQEVQWFLTYGQCDVSVFGKMDKKHQLFASSKTHHGAALYTHPHHSLIKPTLLLQEYGVYPSFSKKKSCGIRYSAVAQRMVATKVGLLVIAIYSFTLAVTKNFENGATPFCWIFLVPHRNSSCL